MIWVRDIFLGVFKFHLTQELGYEARVFADEGNLPAGTKFPLALKTALAHSKTLVPIWSMQYFLSDWCMTECLVMLNRERRLGFRTKHNPYSLILPVRLFGGRAYPPFASEFEPA